MAYSTRWEQEYEDTIEECVRANQVVATEESPRHWILSGANATAPDLHMPIIKGPKPDYTNRPATPK